MWTDAPDCNRQCATDMCCRPASSRLEAGSVASYYCESCREIINRSRRYAPTIRRVVIESRDPESGLPLDTDNWVYRHFVK